MLLSAKNWPTVIRYCMVCLPTSWMSYSWYRILLLALFLSLENTITLHLLFQVSNGYRLDCFFKTLLFIDEARNGMAPSCLSDMLGYRMSTRQLRSTACAELSRSESNLHQVFWWSRVSVAGSKLWNQLPLSIRQSSTVDTFTKELRTRTFKLAYV